MNEQTKKEIMFLIQGAFMEGFCLGQLEPNKGIDKGTLELAMLQKQKVLETILNPKN